MWSFAIINPTDAVQRSFAEKVEESGAVSRAFVHGALKVYAAASSLI